MCISNTGYLQDCSWESYINSKNWTLSGDYDGGTRKVYITIQDASGNIGQNESSYTVYKSCTTTTKNYTDSNYGTCSKACGGGVQYRNYQSKDTYLGMSCASGRDERSCNTQSCCNKTIDYSWSAWSSCSKTCGGGTQTRTVYRKSSYDGSSCGSYQQTQSCNTQGCTMYRYRNIQNPTITYNFQKPRSQTIKGCMAGTNPNGYDSNHQPTSCCMPGTVTKFEPVKIGNISINMPVTEYDKCAIKFDTVSGERAYCSQGELIRYEPSNNATLEMNAYLQEHGGSTSVAELYLDTFGIGGSVGWYFCEKRTTTCPSGYTLSGGKCYGPWSEWSYTAVTANANREVQTKTG